MVGTAAVYLEKIIVVSTHGINNQLKRALRYKGLHSNVRQDIVCYNNLRMKSKHRCIKVKVGMWLCVNLGRARQERMRRKQRLPPTLQWQNGPTPDSLRHGEALEFIPRERAKMFFVWLVQKFCGKEPFPLHK